MPFAVENLTEWVKTLGLPDEQQKAVIASLGTPEVLPKVGETILMRSDYSKRMDALKADEERLKAEYDERVKKEDAFHGELGAWKQGKEKVLADAVQKREQAEAALVAVREKIKNLGTEYAIPDDVLESTLKAIPIASSTPDKKNDQPRDDEGRFVPREELAQMAKDYIKLPALLNMLRDEHLELFGSNGVRVDWMKLVEDAQKNNHTLRAEWETQFKVPEKRTEIAAAAEAKKLKEAEDRGAERARSELLAQHPELATTVRTGRSEAGSPVLNLSREHAKGTKPDETATGQGRGIAAAVKAFQDGKYEGGKEKAA